MFKPGDQVVCVDSGTSFFLKRGHTYTVAKVYDGYVAVEECRVKYPGFFADRFRPVTKVPFHMSKLD